MPDIEKIRMRFIFVMLLLTLACSTLTAQFFSDIPADHWAQDAVRELKEKGIIQGYENANFKGKQTLSRYEIAVLLKRTIQNTRKVDLEFLEKLHMLLDEFSEDLRLLAVDNQRINSFMAGVEEKVNHLEAGQIDQGNTIQQHEKTIDKLKRQYSRLKSRVNLNTGLLIAALITLLVKG